MAKLTSTFAASGSDGRTYTVEVWTAMIKHLGHEIPGATENRLRGSREPLFDVSGKDGQWEIGTTGIIITKV